MNVLLQDECWNFVHDVRNYMIPAVDLNMCISSMYMIWDRSGYMHRNIDVKDRSRRSSTSGMGTVHLCMDDISMAHIYRF